jgi:hypothetical protein
VELKEGAEEKLNVAVAAAQNTHLTSRISYLVARVETLETEARAAVPMDVYREITRNAEHAFRAAAPVNSAAAVIAVDTPQSNPVLWSKEAVLDWLRSLDWQSNEIEVFASNRVSGAMLMHDISSKMCTEWGVSELRLSTMTRLLSHWKPNWGVPKKQ